MSVYFKSAWMYIKSEMEYKLSFFLTMLGSMMNTLFAVLGIVFLLQKFGSVGGWSIHEVMLTTGLAIFGHASSEMILYGLNHFHFKVKSGVLDQMMVRPRSIIFQVVCSEFELNKIGRLIESVVILIYGLLNINIVWTPYKVLVLALMIIGTFILFSALLVLKGAFCFWAIDGMELMNILQEGGRDLSSYPISIYKDWFAKFFTYIVPFGMCNYFPLVFLLDKQGATWWYGLAPLATIPFTIAMLGLWKIGLANYKSTGS